MVFSGKADDHQSEADRIQTNLPDDPNACNSAVFAGPCTDLANAQRDATHARRWAAASYVTLGVASAATIGYGLWLGLSDSSTPMQATVDVGEGSAAIRLRGTF